MRTRYHIVASTGISIGCQMTLHSWPATLGCFFSGILIDLDHYLEYFITHRKIPFRYKDLLDFCLNHKEKRLYLFFHAYEYLFVLWLLIYFSYLGKFWIGIAIGLTTHLIFDQFTNPIKPPFYFLTYRIINKFETKNMVTKEFFERRT